MNKPRVEHTYSKSGNNYRILEDGTIELQDSLTGKWYKAVDKDKD